MDGEIASNRSVVQDQVIALRQTVTDSNEAQNPNIDMQTTLQGNSKLHSVVEKEMDIVHRFRQAFLVDVSNLQRVAEAMEAQDQQLAK